MANTSEIEEEEESEKKPKHTLHLNASDEESEALLRKNGTTGGDANATSPSSTDPPPSPVPSVSLGIWARFAARLPSMAGFALLRKNGTTGGDANATSPSSTDPPSAPVPSVSLGIWARFAARLPSMQSCLSTCAFLKHDELPVHEKEAEKQRVDNNMVLYGFALFGSLSLLALIDSLPRMETGSAEEKEEDEKNMEKLKHFLFVTFACLWTGVALGAALNANARCRLDRCLGHHCSRIGMLAVSLLLLVYIYKKDPQSSGEFFGLVSSIIIVGHVYSWVGVCFGMLMGTAEGSEVIIPSYSGYYGLNTLPDKIRHGTIQYLPFPL